MTAFGQKRRRQPPTTISKKKVFFFFKTCFNIPTMEGMFFCSDCVAYRQFHIYSKRYYNNNNHNTHNNHNNEYIFYSAIPRWESSTCLFAHMCIIYIIYIYDNYYIAQLHNTSLINCTQIKHIVLNVGMLLKNKAETKSYAEENIVIRTFLVIT